MDGLAPLGDPWSGAASLSASHHPSLEPSAQAAHTLTSSSSYEELLSFEKVIELTPKAGLMTKYACPVCGKEFVNKKDFRRHYMTHTGEKPYHCPLCPYRAGQKSSVQRHINLIHAKDAPMPGGK